MRKGVDRITVRHTGKTYALTRIVNDIRDAIFALYDKDEERARKILISLRRNMAELLSNGFLDDENFFERVNSFLEAFENGDRVSIKEMEEFLEEVQRRIWEEMSEEGS